MKTVIRGGVVLTLGQRTPNFDEADVLVEDGVVTEIGPGLRSRDAEEVDATDGIVMPGFVDTHRHVWKTLLKGQGQIADGDLAATIDAHSRRLQPDDVYAATLLGLLSAVEVGFTTVVDWADIQVDDRFTEAALQAHADAGLRTVLVHAPPAWAEGMDHHAAVRRAVANGVADGTTTVLGYGSPDADPDGLDRVADGWRLARELGLRIHAHAGVRPADRGAVAQLAERKLLDGDVTLVHCCHLGDDDLDAIASAGAAVSSAPASEMAAGMGPPPLQRLIDRNIRPGLGVDDELAAPGDPFGPMRAAQSLQHANSFELKLAGRARVPDLLSTRQVIRYATVDGARAAGLAEVTGSLEVGKEADIVVLRADRPNIAPVNDPIGAVVWGMDPSNVDWVFVGGRPVVRAGELDADVQRARELAVAARERMAAPTGPLETSSGGPR